MIDFHTYQQIHQLHHQQGLHVAQIARQLNLNPETIARWLAQPRYQARQQPRRASKLDAFRAEVIRLLNHHPYSAQQLLQRLRESGYTGGYSILKELVRTLRPPSTPACLSLHFLPGQSAQIDWGHAGWLTLASTRRRVSFFVMVLSYSRRLFVEFTLAQSMEHFLQAHRRAWEYFGAVTHEVLVDNCKTAVLSHPTGGPATLHPRYLEFAQHYGFTIKPCAPRQPQQKGRVESAVAYIKGNFLAGLELHSLEALNAAAGHWLETVANVRLHAETRTTPNERFLEEIPKLRRLHALAYETCVLVPAHANARARVVYDTNRYSIPARFAGRQLLLKVFPERLVIYHADQLLTEHPRSYERHQDFEKPEHLEELLAQRRQGRRQLQLVRFLRLSPHAEAYHQQLVEKRVNAPHHLQKILALSETYGAEATARALEDAWAYQAIGAEYLANLLAQRAHPQLEPGALHLTRGQDLLDLELPDPDLSVYDPPGGAS